MSRQFTSPSSEDAVAKPGKPAMRNHRVHLLQQAVDLSGKRRKGSPRRESGEAG
jgi:hypothetical protein